MKKLYYGVEFWSGRNTTTGDHNPRTGRMSIACDIQSFESISARNDWVDNGKITADMGGNNRETITKKKVRALCLGMSIVDYNEYLDYIS